MSLKFEMDSGKIKQYPTWWTDLGCEEYYPEKPYRTKCGLSFKKDPENGACDHLECAIDAARTNAINAPLVLCSLFLMDLVSTWYGKGDFLVALHESMLFIIPILFVMLFSLSPFRHWMELREYKNHGTIHGRRARRL
jgi:hypothetical protein